MPLDPAALDPLERAALSRCGAGEQGLREAARAVAAGRLRGLPPPEPDAIASMQRAAGEPHPWARTWVASARDLERPAVLERLDAWLRDAPARGERRCAVAGATAADGTRALAVVAADALADLSPLPTRARAGQWLAVAARLRVGASGASVVVLGPAGAPRRVPTSFDGSTAHAVFAPDAPGAFTVQVMADVEGGWRPVLEATVFADVPPSVGGDARAAPGEDRAGLALAPDALVLEMTNAARAWAAAPPLARDARLDAVALEHAQVMAHTRRLAHDAGDGDPFDRLRAAGVAARDVGENVAHAATVALAHRALWDSPSHRANLLRREFQRAGVAVVRDAAGDVWVVEELAGR